MKNGYYIPPVSKVLELNMGNHVLFGSDPQSQQQIAPVWEDEYEDL
jgi:hypothetical protein